MNNHQLLSEMHELVKGTNPNYVLGDRSYGKSDVRILHVVKDGESHNRPQLLSFTTIVVSFRAHSQRQGTGGLDELDFIERKGLSAWR